MTDGDILLLQNIIDNDFNQFLFNAPENYKDISRVYPLAGTHFNLAVMHLKECEKLLKGAIGPREVK